MRHPHLALALSAMLSAFSCGVHANNAGTDQANDTSPAAAWDAPELPPALRALPSHVFGSTQRSRAYLDARATGADIPAYNPDPLEPLNRKVYAFNDGLDTYIARPLANAYSHITPAPIRQYGSNFFNNLEDVWSTVNHALQLRPKHFFESAFRVSMNTFLGFGGFINIADDMGLERDTQDLGKTLGRWGASSGPYLVLPVFGASSLRDGLGKIGDAHYSLISQTDHVPSRNSLYALDLLDTRTSLLEAGNLLEEAALDKYAFTRNAYLQKRAYEIAQIRGHGTSNATEGDDDRWWEDDDATESE